MTFDQIQHQPSKNQPPPDSIFESMLTRVSLMLAITIRTSSNDGRRLIRT